MGVLKFQLTSPDLASRLADLRKAYVTGLDRTPSRLGVEFRQGLMICHRENDRERPALRPLAGRGVRHADRRHRHPGRAARALPPGRRAGPGQAQRRPQPARRLEADGPAGPGRARPACWPRRIARSSRRPPRRDDPAASLAAAQASLAAASEAGQPPGRGLHRPGAPDPAGAPAKLPTQLGRRPRGRPQAGPLGRRARRRRSTRPSVRCTWKTLAPTEGQVPLGDARRPARLGRPGSKLAVQAGPLVDFRPGALPDWIWLWEGDFDDDPRPGRRPRPPGRHPLPGQGPALAPGPPAGLHRLPRPLRGGADPARRPALQVARQADPAAQFTVGRRPPLGRVDGLEHRSSSARSTWPTTSSAPTSAWPAIALEIAPGYSAPGQPPPRPLRLLAAARPLRPAEPPAAHLDRRCPRRPAPDPQADPTSRSRPTSGPAPPDEATPGRLGRPVDRPGRRQAVRPLGHLAPARATPPPTSTPTAASSAPTRPPSRSSPGSSRSAASSSPDHHEPGGMIAMSTATVPPRQLTPDDVLSGSPPGRRPDRGAASEGNRTPVITAVNLRIAHGRGERGLVPAPEWLTNPNRPSRAGCLSPFSGRNTSVIRL